MLWLRKQSAHSTYVLFKSVLESANSVQPAATSYSAPSNVQKDVKATPFPASWADPALKEIFDPAPTESSPALSTASPSNPATDSGKSVGVGAITGAVVGSVVFVLLIAAAFFLLRRHRRARANFSLPEHKPRELASEGYHGHDQSDFTGVRLSSSHKHELPVLPSELPPGDERRELPVPPSELSPGDEWHELMVRQTYELSGERMSR